MNDLAVKDALDKYRTQISILKKGYAQEKYRIEQISRSFLADKTVRQVTSVDIATYRDQRLETIFIEGGYTTQRPAMDHFHLPC